jgi:hypothetical protein
MFDTIVILILVVYGGIHFASLYAATMPLGAKLIVELSHAEVLVHHEIEVVHGYLIHGEATFEANLEDIEANLKIFENMS